ncbi:MAG: DUF4336 domain-containing protein [Candidatus Eremiobacteraeota bacterium]|nr:DUF4336 domain-containing protein [Candidatus Eremiobacteraeota bacterium]
MVDSLQRFAENLWIAEGPTVRFFGMPYPTRMIVVRLVDGSLWVNSPVAATREEAGQLEHIGPIAHLVSPTRLHDWRLKQWAEFFPQAQVWKARVLGDAPPQAWKADIDQLIFRGSRVLSEAEFFHRHSRTLIVGDFIQNFQPYQGRVLRNAFLRFGGILQGGAPRDLRLSFAGKRHTELGRESLRKLLAWDFDKLVPAHGDCVDGEAQSFVKRSFRWLRSA